MPQSAVKRVRVRVEGRVQGVYFRASTQERARALGLCGWVRNTADGAVELEAQGPAGAVDQLVAWCHQGPSRRKDASPGGAPPRRLSIAPIAARVDRVEVQDLAGIDPAASDFLIRR